MLSKGAIELSSGDTGFISNVFVVPEHTDDVQPILNLMWFDCYMYIPTFKMPVFRLVQQLIQCHEYTFSIDLKDAYLDKEFW